MIDTIADIEHYTSAMAVDYQDARESTAARFQAAVEGDNLKYLMRENRQSAMAASISGQSTSSQLQSQLRKEEINMSQSNAADTHQEGIRAKHSLNILETQNRISESEAMTTSLAIKSQAATDAAKVSSNMLAQGLDFMIGIADIGQSLFDNEQGRLSDLNIAREKIKTDAQIAKLEAETRSLAAGVDFTSSILRGISGGITAGLTTGGK